MSAKAAQDLLQMMRLGQRRKSPRQEPLDVGLALSDVGIRAALKVFKEVDII